MILFIHISFSPHFFGFADLYQGDASLRHIFLSLAKNPFYERKASATVLSFSPLLGIINRESGRLAGNANTTGYLRLGISASGGTWIFAPFLFLTTCTI